MNRRLFMIATFISGLALIIGYKKFDLFKNDILTENVDGWQLTNTDIEKLNQKGN